MKMFSKASIFITLAVLSILIFASCQVVVFTLWGHVDSVNGNKVNIKTPGIGGKEKNKKQTVEMPSSITVEPCVWLKIKGKIKNGKYIVSNVHDCEVLEELFLWGHVEEDQKGNAVKIEIYEKNESDNPTKKIITGTNYTKTKLKKCQWWGVKAIKIPLGKGYAPDYRIVELGVIEGHVLSVSKKDTARGYCKISIATKDTNKFTVKVQEKYCKELRSCQTVRIKFEKPQKNSTPYIKAKDVEVVERKVELQGRITGRGSPEDGFCIFYFETDDGKKYKIKVKKNMVNEAKENICKKYYKRENRVNRNFKIKGKEVRRGVVEASEVKSQ